MARQVPETPIATSAIPAIFIILCILYRNPRL
jgi:hypothetical protein